MSNRRRLTRVIHAPTVARMAHAPDLISPDELRELERTAVTLRPGRGSSGIVRNVTTGRVLPCCWADCENDGDNRIRIEAPHPQPRWKDPTTGRQEMEVYIFCSESHRLAFAKGTPYERYC